jgi:dTDP-glucose 4,6-dehydratase
MTKRIWISGAGGFVGHHFLEHVLYTTNWEVVATDSFRHKGKTDRISEVIASKPSWRKRVTVVTHDLTVPFSKQGIQKLGHIDYMAAFASESHVDRSITDPVPFIRNNIDVATTTLELARELKPKALIWVSTDEVYGAVEADDLTGHPEWAPILPSNPYSGSKAAQEAIATSYWRTYGVPVVFVNCMNMIGERQDPEKYVPMVTAKVNAGETVTIHGTPGNIGTRHYLHSRNLADAMIFLFKKQSPALFPAHANYHDAFPAAPRVADRPDRYNVASPDRIDNLALAQMISEDVGKELKYELVDFHSARPGHDPHYGLDSSKLFALGWEMPVPFRDSLRNTVKWTLEHKEWMIPDE